MAVNFEELIFPTLECLHIAGFAMAIGTTAIVDLRILDLGFRTQSSTQLAKDTTWWMLGGLLLAIFTGFGLYSTDPDMYYMNWSFLIKMGCLIAAILFHYTIRRAVARSADSPDGASAAGKLAAVISILLWSSVIFGGIFIAFIPGGL